MEDFKERKHKRYPVKIEITHSLINKLDFRNLEPEDSFGNHHKGIMKNISKEGLYFESSTPCIVGTKIYVSLMGDSTGLPIAPIDDLCSGVVVWCMKNDAENQPEYKVGIRFEEPI